MTKYRIIEEKTEDGRSYYIIQKYSKLSLFSEKYVWEDLIENNRPVRFGKLKESQEFIKSRERSVKINREEIKIP